MAQPTPYTREFNFSNQQAATPATPIPAPHLDAELNRVKLTTDEIINNLGLIQNDQGELIADSIEGIADLEGYVEDAEAAAASAAESVLQIEALLDALEVDTDPVPTILMFSGDDVTTTFDIGEENIAEEKLNVHISGVYQQKNAYTVSGSNIVFDEAPPTGSSNIEVAIFGAVAVAYATATLPDGSVPTEILATLPTTGNFTGRMVYLTTNSVLYAYNGGWFPVGTGAISGLPDDTALVEIVGTLPTTGNFEGRIAYLTTDDTLYAYDGSDWAVVSGSGGGLPEDTVGIEIVNSLPEDDNFEGRVAYLTTDDKIYSYNGAGWVPLVDITDVNFPDGFTGIQIVSVLPDTSNFEGRTVYLTTDNLLYTFDGSIWIAVGFEEDGDPGGLPDGTVGIEIVDTLPVTDNFEGRVVYLTTDGKLYTFTDGVWKNIVDGEDVNFPDGFTGIQITSSLPAVDNFEGRTVYLETDGKLYTYTDGDWTSSVDAEDILGTITSTQISDDAITTPKLAAGSIIASKLAASSVTTNAIAAGAINAAKIAASTITSDKLAANSVTASAIVAGAVTAAKISVTNLAAVSGTLGSVNIQSAVLGSLEVDTINLAGNAVTVQAGAETAGAASINGSGYTSMQSVTVSWGGTASVWVFFQFRSPTAEDLSLQIRSGGTVLTTKSFRAGQNANVVYMDLFPSGAVSGAAVTAWLKRDTAGSTSIFNRKLLVLAAKR